MSSLRISLAAALALAWTATPALAAPPEDLVAAVQRANHDQHSGWIVERLMTLNAPRDVEQSGWSGQIENAFARVSSNK